MGAAPLLQTLAALVFVLLLVFGAAWALRTVQNFTPNGFRKLPLALIGGIGVGGKERVLIVEVGEEWLVLGVTSASITTLHRLPKPEQAQEPLAPHAFSDLLKRFRMQAS